MSPLEADLPGVRRLEAPVLVDRRGTGWALGLIDVTVRHGDRTVLAEAPPSGLPTKLERALREAALRFAGARGKAGAFTVSFLAHPAQGDHRFAGTASGLPATVALLEALNEMDLPALEAHLARGGTLDGELPEPRGHALQISLAALDPEDGFAPRPGTVESLRLPAGAGLRADPAVEEGGVPASPGYGIARVTAHGRTRIEALTRLQRGLAATEVAVRGGTTDKAFLTEVLDRPELTNGDAEPGWLDQLVDSGEHLPRRGAEVALLAAAIAGYETESAAARARFYESAARGRPEVPEEIGRSIELHHRGHKHLLHVARLALDLFRIEVAGRRLEIRAGRPGRTGRTLACGEKSWRVSLAAEGSRWLVEVDGIPHRIDQGEDGAARSPALSDERRTRFDGLEAAPEASPLDEARRLIQGYDVDPEVVERLLSGPAGPPGDPVREEEILSAFVAVCSLFGRQPATQRAEDGRQSAVEYLFTYLQDPGSQGAGLPLAFLDKLRHALAHYGVGSLDRSPDLEESLFRIAISHQRLSQEVPAVLALLERWLERGDRPLGPGFRDLLERMISETQGSEPAVHDLAREVRYRLFDRTVLLAARERVYATAEADLARLAHDRDAGARAERIRALVDCTQPLHRILSQRFESAGSELREALLEIMVRRYYRIRELRSLSFTTYPAQDGQLFAIGDYDYQGSHVHLIATHSLRERPVSALAAARDLAGRAAPGSEVVADLYFWGSGPPVDDDATADEIAALLAGTGLSRDLHRVAVTLSFPGGMRNFTFRRDEDALGAFREERVYRGIHAMVALRLQLWRLQSFRLERLPSPQEVYFFHGVAHENPKDERLFAIAEVRDLTPVRDAAGRVVQLPQLEHMLMETLASIRRFQARRAATERLQWNRVLLYAWPPVDLRPDELEGLVQRLAPFTEGLGLEKVAVRCRIPDPEGGELRDWVLEISRLSEGGAVLRFRRPREVLLKPLREYAQRVVDLRRQGLPYPYEVIKLLAPPRRSARADLPEGEFIEHDLDASGRLVPVDRPYGGNTAGLVVGIVRNFTDCYPEGMARVIVLSDPSQALGALAEPECRRLLAALDLAAGMGVPLEWFALSAGSAGSAGGTEGMDWIGRVLRRLVEFSAGGGEVNVVVMGKNAGIQPYWIAQATVPMHTRGISVMTSEGTLNGSGGVPAGEAQYFAKDLGEACRILLRHYEHTYVAPGERFPRPAPTCDPRQRELRDLPHGSELRRVLAAVVDQDHEPLERWYGMRGGESAVVWDAHLGGRPVCLVGFETQPLASILSPGAAQKLARAIYAASGNRPLVVLADLEPLHQGPLESVAEIGHAVVSFRGPIVLCNVSRDPGSAFPVFATVLHDNLEVVRLERTERLRSCLIEAVERGMAREEAPSSPRPSSPVPSHPPHREKRETSKTSQPGTPRPGRGMGWSGEGQG